MPLTADIFAILIDYYTAYLRHSQLTLAMTCCYTPLRHYAYLRCH